MQPYRLDSDAYISHQILENLRNRKLSQKFLYTGEGAKTFYDYYRKIWGEGNAETVTINDWKDFILGECSFIKNSATSLISLACGDSLIEANICGELSNKNLQYVGIDVSEEMIQMSASNLAGAQFETSLIRSDLENSELRATINRITKGTDNRIFAFLGNTFSNLATTNITDLVASYMNKGDFLTLDITIKEPTIKASLELYDYYIDKIQSNEGFRNYILSGLKYANFPLNVGKITLETEQNNEIGLYKINFYYELEEDVSYELNEEEVYISKGEKIMILDLYTYEEEKLIKFMSFHKFKRKKSNIKKLWGQFLFEKE